MIIVDVVGEREIKSFESDSQTFLAQIDDDKPEHN